MADICWAEQNKLTYPRIGMLRQIVDDLISAKRMARQNDIFVTSLSRIIDPGTDIVVRLRQIFIP